MSLVLRLLGREPDPAKSREHVLLSVLAERRLLAGQTAELGALMQDVLEPPITQIGALSVNALPGSQRLRALLVFDEVYGFLPWAIARGSEPLAPQKTYDANTAYLIGERRIALPKTYSVNTVCFIGERRASSPR